MKYLNESSCAFAAPLLRAADLADYFASGLGSCRVEAGVTAPSLQIWQQRSQVRKPRSPAPVLDFDVCVAR